MALWLPSIAVWLCLLSTARAANRKPVTMVVPSIHGLWPCPDKKHYYTQQNFTITKDALGCDMINTEFAITHEIRRYSKLTAIGWRRAEGNAWEYYGTWTWTTALCELLASKGGLWSPVIQNIVPTFKCPVPSGSYKMYNGTTDFGLLDKLIPGGDKYTWRIELQLYDGLGDLAVCLNSAAHITRVLVKGRGPQKG